MTGQPADDALDALLGEQAVMGVFRNMEPAAAVARARRAWDAGVRNVEIPVQTPDAMPTLRAVVDAGRERGLVVGAGTIVSAEQIAEVAAAGAGYTVAPGLDPAIVRLSIDAGLPHVPGVATASEIQLARSLGLRWVKGFPASVLGSSWIKAMLGPFPDQRFIVTGGMNATTAPSFLAAGARVVAMGDAFDDPAQLAEVSALLRG